MAALEKNDQWTGWFQDLLQIVRRSRWNGRSTRGNAEDAVVSAIKSALKRINCPPHDDPAIFDFIAEQLKRKIDTYRHAYRTGDGKTLRMSQIGNGDDNFPFELIETIQQHMPGQQLVGPPTDFDGPFTPAIVEACLAWIDREAQTFETPAMRDVLALWLDGATTDETEQALGLTHYGVKTLRKSVKEELQRRAAGDERSIPTAGVAPQ